ncbi:CSMD [Mytilus coruscus]|uniref:CSMD n=1 Tax=Mytilus coruscus TaxID=42192 RepID=A0A6J8DB06_MYTCO|nr:CSMD [Mytilus coruscus]
MDVYNSQQRLSLALSTSSGCHKNGTCIGDKCSCPNGYTGVLCQSEILECLTEPCQNNGICNDRIGIFTCTCVKGYSGRLCEFDSTQSTLTPKSRDCPPCLNGTCLHDIFGVVCICNNGYTGKDCSVPLMDPNVVSTCPEYYFGPDCRKFCKEFDDCAYGH